MEKVQFQQEQMLPELRDLLEKKIFTLKEVKQILRKRTEFERALVRRMAKKSDYIRYIEYEMGLELLRRKRVKRLNVQDSFSRASSFAFVRRQFHLFERALKKFKDDIGLWIQYIQVAKQEGARALAGRVMARAIQTHPRAPSLYIIAASHELEHHSPSAARTLLQRGLRFNNDSVELWQEYVKMEMTFVESLERRWTVLGVNEGTGDDGPETDSPGLEARQAIMDGAIVKSVIGSAIRAIPTEQMLKSLDTVICEHPSGLKHVLLSHIGMQLEDMVHDNHAPEVVRLMIERLERDQGIEAAHAKLKQLVAQDSRLKDLHRQFAQAWAAR